MVTDLIETRPQFRVILLTDKHTQADSTAQSYTVVVSCNMKGSSFLQTESVNGLHCIIT